MKEINEEGSGWYDLLHAGEMLHCLATCPEEHIPALVEQLPEALERLNRYLHRHVPGISGTVDAASILLVQQVESAHQKCLQHAELAELARLLAEHLQRCPLIVQLSLMEDALVTIADVESETGYSRKELEEKIAKQQQRVKASQEGVQYGSGTAFLQEYLDRLLKVNKKFEAAFEAEQQEALKANQDELCVIGHNVYLNGQRIAGLERQSEYPNEEMGWVVTYTPSQELDVPESFQASAVCMLSALIQQVQVEKPVPMSFWSMQEMMKKALAEASPLWLEMLQMAWEAHQKQEMVEWYQYVYTEKLGRLLRILEAGGLCNSPGHPRLRVIQEFWSTWKVVLQHTSFEEVRRELVFLLNMTGLPVFSLKRIQGERDES
jgi:hypothetical protein